MNQKQKKRAFPFRSLCPLVPGGHPGSSRRKEFHWCRNIRRLHPLGCRHLHPLGCLHHHQLRCVVSFPFGTLTGYLRGQGRARCYTQSRTRGQSRWIFSPSSYHASDLIVLQPDLYLNPKPTLNLNSNPNRYPNPNLNPNPSPSLKP